MHSVQCATTSLFERNIALFVEDYAHQQVIGALVQKVTSEWGINARLDWRSAVGGHGKVITELKVFIRDLERQGSPRPELIIVATDANCKGFNERRKEIGRLDTPTAPPSELYLAVAVRLRTGSVAANSTNES